jgi:ubiquinone/menaquinone biosynthesis C-methylase UbiE
LPHVRNAEFNDPCLVAVYDAAYGWSRDDDFFLAVVSEVPAARVLDLGCGTGRLALGLAAAGHAVTGVDPAAASLAAARAKAGADRVTWMQGRSAALPDETFDIVVMTSHVAQFFVSDDEWLRTLGDIQRALVPGGRLTFDSRDPAARRWEDWNPIDSRRQITMPDGSVVGAWTEVTAISDGVVDYAIHYLMPGGDELLAEGTLKFRTERELRTSLRQAGFTVEQIYGGWNREPIGAPDGEFLVIART